MSKLLIDEPPLIVLPRLAALVGVDESLVLQQVHFLSLLVHPDEDGFRWVRKTYGEWHEVFYFYSPDTVKRVFRTLEKGEYLFTRMDKKWHGSDRTKSYRVNYPKLDAVPHRGNLHGHEGKMPSSSGQSAPMLSGQNAPSDIIRTDNNYKNNLYIPSPDGQIYTFKQFKADHPRWRNGPEAEKAWNELNPDAELQADIRDGLKRAKNSTDWETKKFIPRPDTWLRARGWEDEYVARGTNAVQKAKTDPVPETTPAEPELKKREYSNEEIAQNTQRLRDALKGAKVPGMPVET